MFVWTVDGVIAAFMISLAMLCGLLVAISVVFMKVKDWWRNRK